MMGWTHMIVSATATSLILGTANPAVIAVGAVSGLLPDVDISTSFAGQILPWISRWLERRFPHRSCTHSFAASGFIATLTYGITYLTGGKFWQIATAISIGYFFGWFIDAFTKSGVEMFYPSPIRCVCPSNRNFRLKSGSSAEYGLLILVMAIAIFSFNINANGGVLTQFNRLIAAPSGVEQIYNESGSSHLIKAHIKGVMTSDRSPVLGDFLIIQSLGNSFVVQSLDGKLYKAGIDPESQILINRVTADSSEPAVTTIESIVLEDDELSRILSRFSHDNAMVFVSGEITIDDPDIKFALDPHQFPFIKRSQTTDSPGIKLEVAPLKYIKKKLGDQFATGQLSIRSIIKNGETFTNSSSQPKE